METLAILKAGASQATGIDIRINPAKRELIRQQYPNMRYRLEVMDATRMTFEDDSFDAAVTCGSFEHFHDPEAVLSEGMRVTKPGGRIFLTSGVWSHPWGAHMNFFTLVPWVHFLFSEKTIMNVRKQYRDDGATQFHEVEGGLNKVGIRKFNAIVEKLGLEKEHLKLMPVKKLNFLTKIPYVDEFFTGLIIAILKKKEAKGGFEPPIVFK